VSANAGTRRRMRSAWRFLTADQRSEAAIDLGNEIREQHPTFVNAVIADARVAAIRRDERPLSNNRFDAVVQVLRLIVVTDAFFAQVCYRAKASCQARHIAVVPRVMHRLAIVTGQICIGDLAVLEPGVYIPHGQVVIDAVTVVGAGATLSPFTTLGRRAGVMGGPRIGALTMIGTGAKVLGPVKVGTRAQVGANSVVFDEVPNGATAVGGPARIVIRPTRRDQTTNDT
jgi:serine O-acetyltransferase